MSTADVEILVIVPVSDETLSRIAAIDPRVRVVDARGWFDVEIRETWPPRTVQRYLGQRAVQVSSRKQRDRLLAGAEVVLAGWPPLLDLRGRAPRLRWLHQLPAGASNLLRADLWGSDVTVTTSRGYGNTRAMAEYVLACFYNFTRELHHAYRADRTGGQDRMCRRRGRYRPGRGPAMRERGDARDRHPAPRNSR